MPNAYPTVEELTSWFVDNGLTAPSNLESVILGTIKDFERRTGYVPFLGSAVTVFNTYDPPFLIRDFTLDLGCGFWEVDSVDLNDTTLTASDDYDLLPLNIEGEDRGWDKIRFHRHPGSKPASIIVTGKLGYSEHLPDDVYLAIFNEAASRAMQMTPALGAVTQEKQGGRSVSYSDNNSFYKTSKASFNNTILGYTRI